MPSKHEIESNAFVHKNVEAQRRALVQVGNFEEKLQKNERETLRLDED